MTRTGNPRPLHQNCTTSWPRENTERYTAITSRKGERERESMHEEKERREEGEGNYIV